jgi:hypothetical protein
MRAGLPPDHEEHRPDAFVRQRLEHGVGVGRLRSVVEGEHDLAFGERQRPAVIHQSKHRHVARAQRHDAAGSERVRISCARCGMGCGGAGEGDPACQHRESSHALTHTGLIVLHARRCGGVCVGTLLARGRACGESPVHHEWVRLIADALAPEPQSD